MVRPQNLGLGYGSFREATSLKTNRPIADEVRGIDWKRNETKKKRNAARPRRSNGATGVGGGKGGANEEWDGGGKRGGFAEGTVAEA